MKFLASSRKTSLPRSSSANLKSNNMDMTTIMIMTMHMIMVKHQEVAGAPLLACLAVEVVPLMTTTMITMIMSIQ